MASQDGKERLRRAVTDACRRLERPSQDQPFSSTGPVPGELYVFGTPVEAMIEWLVVRSHPDDCSLVLLAPADDFPFAGRSDVVLKPEFIDRPLTVRCGETIWVPASGCQEHLRVGAVPNEAVGEVRRKLAALARGQIADESDAARVDADPEYLAWLRHVSIARESLERRVEPASTVKGLILSFQQFTSNRPTYLPEEPQLSLAANPGGPLLAELAESLASDTPRYSETALNSGGTLSMTADASGVRVWWRVPAGVTPPNLSVPGPSGRIVATWHAVPQTEFHRADPAFPWMDGQVVLEFGGDNPQSVTVRL